MTHACPVDEELAVGDAPAAVRVAVVGVDEDEVHIGRNVQFAATQLTHPDDDQRLRGRRAEQLAVRCREQTVIKRRRSADRSTSRVITAPLPATGTAGEVARQRMDESRRSAAP